MKRLLIAITLVCVLSGTALAGEMPGVNSRPLMEDVSRVESTSTLSVDGEMPGVNSETSTESSLIVTMLLEIVYFIGR